MLQDTWTRFRITRSLDDRNTLIIHYQPLVKKVAYQLLRKLPSHFEVEDLIAYGQFGLVDAISRFDPELGFLFSTFASTRIRGAMLDELRLQDWAPRRVRATTREIDVVTDMLATEMGRRPTLDEVAERIGVPLSDLVTAQSEANKSMLSSLDGVPEWSESEDMSASDHALGAELSMTGDAFSAAIVRLPMQDQHIIRMYYLDGLRMKEIGKRLGLGESRACAAHARAALLLREHLSLVR